MVERKRGKKEERDPLGYHVYTPEPRKDE